MNQFSLSKPKKIIQNENQKKIFGIMTSFLKLKQIEMNKKFLVFIFFWHYYDRIINKTANFIILSQL